MIGFLLGLCCLYSPSLFSIIYTYSNLIFSFFDLSIAIKIEGDALFCQVRVEDTHLQVDAPPEEDLTCCEVCGQSNREDRLLLCDGCDLA